jgi:hypothetical protein
MRWSTWSRRSETGQSGVCRERLLRGENMASKDLIDGLNEALNREISTFLRYMLQAAQIKGAPWEAARTMYEAEVADEVEHAQYLAQAIVIHAPARYRAGSRRCQTLHKAGRAGRARRPDRAQAPHGRAGRRRAAARSAHAAPAGLRPRCPCGFKVRAGEQAAAPGVLPSRQIPPSAPRPCGRGRIEARVRASDARMRGQGADRIRPLTGRWREAPGDG